MNEATGIDCTSTISVITDMEKFDTVEAALNQLIDGNSDLEIGRSTRLNSSHITRSRMPSSA